MLQYPQIDTVALSFGPIQVHWYGLMYVFAFLAGWFLARYRAKQKGSGWTVENVDDVATLSMLGVILGGRLGYVLFYDLSYYLSAPLEIFYVWNGGMSFHGGLIGVIAALYFYSHKEKRRFLNTLDFIAPVVAPGLFFGRIGNFINAELWGKVSDVSWAMVFPNAGLAARHPTQLYEATLEGLVLFVILWIYSSKERNEGAVAGLFAILYSVFRFTCEFFREPDTHIGYLISDWFTMGMALSIPLLLVGIALYYFSFYKSKNPSRDKVVLNDGTVIYVKR